MSHIEHIPSLLKFAYCKKELSVSDGANWVSNKIERSWNKLCPQAKRIMKNKYRNAKELLEVYDKI